MRDREEGGTAFARRAFTRPEEAAVVISGRTAAGVTVPDTKLAPDANFVDIIENPAWPE
jgi:hypothetical protein